MMLVPAAKPKEEIMRNIGTVANLSLQRPQPCQCEKPAAIAVDAGGGGDFATITEGVGAAANGDTIDVSPGIYLEHVVVNKAVLLRSLEGSGATEISYGTTAFDVLDITVNGVVLSGFTITGGRYGIEISSAVTSFSVTDCTILEPLRQHLALPAHLVGSVVAELDLRPHATHQYDSIVVYGGTVAASTTWPQLTSGFVYYLPSTRLSTSRAPLCPC